MARNVNRGQMTRKSSSRLSPEQRVADIMAAAHDVLRENGYDVTSMSDIAKRANIVEGSIYRFFENKRDLLIKVMENWYSSSLSDYKRQLAGISGTQNRLRYMIWRHLKTIHDEPMLCRIMFQYLREDPGYRSTIVYELNRQYTNSTLDIIREGIESGEFRSDLPLGLTRDLIYGGIEHRIWAYLRNEGDFDPGRTADEIVSLLVHGISVASPTSENLPEPLIRRLEQAVERLERQGR